MGLFDSFLSGPGPTPVTESGGVTQAYSSFGIPGTTTGPEFAVSDFYRNARWKELDMRDSFYSARQHDGKVFDWYGRSIQADHHPTQPLLGAAELPFYIPMSQRRPLAPYRIARIIVDAFTGMTFGDGRWPAFKSDDPLTQDFAEALVTAQSLPSKMALASNIGGACGTVGLSWWFNDKGKPRTRVHHGRYIHVLEWEDVDELIPSHVVELTQFTRMERDGKKRVKVPYWQRRDWTLDADIIFHPVKVEQNKDPDTWTIDERASFIHHDGFCHFVWIQNLPDADPETIDGSPDYDELYEQMNALDALNSTHVAGTQKNLDPTLVIPRDAEDYGDTVIKKGSDNALLVGEGGSASYLTLSSDAINGGITAVQKQREQVLEAAQCVVPDPNTVTAAGTSAVAMKLLYAPMLSKANLRRTQYGEMGILRLIEQQVTSARKLMPDASAADPAQRYVHEVETGADGQPLLNEDGTERTVPVEYVLELPKRIEKEELLDADGNPTGEFEMREYDRVPGKGALELKWPDFFAKTALDKQNEAQSYSTATGGKPVLSQRTAVEEYAAANGGDALEEYARIVDQQAAERAQQEAGMFPPAGGGPTSSMDPIVEPTAPAEVAEDTDAEAPEDEAAPATAPAGEDPGVVQPAAGGPTVELAPTTISKLMTANEARAMLGLGPAKLVDGSPDPDANLPIDTYAAKQAAAAEAEAEAAVPLNTPADPPVV